MPSDLNPDACPCTPHYNCLTPAEAERLAMLAEEAGEVIQVIGKVLRHGYESWHPDSPEVSNRDLLAKEVADFETIAMKMKIAHDFRGVQDNRGEIWQRKLRFTHHQIGHGLSETDDAEHI